MSFWDSYRGYFCVARHNVSDKARGYLAGLMMKAPRKNMERMEEYVECYDYQAQQQFLSDSPWDHRALIARVGEEVDALVGGAESALLIDESGFEKKGTKSVGVARQWNGRVGKVDNSQDIAELLNHYLPRADATEEAVLRNIERRHRKRQDSIEAAYRRQAVKSAAA